MQKKFFQTLLIGALITLTQSAHACYTSNPGNGATYCNCGDVGFVWSNSAGTPGQKCAVCGHGCFPTKPPASPNSSKKGTPKHFSNP